MIQHVMAAKREYLELLQCSYKEELCYALRCPETVLEAEHGALSL